MKPNAINYLSLAKKAGRTEIGRGIRRSSRPSLPCQAPARCQGRSRRGRWRRARNFVAGSGQQLAVVPFSKEELGAALGTERSIPGRHHRPCPGPGLFAGSGRTPSGMRGPWRIWPTGPNGCASGSWRKRLTRKTSSGENADVSREGRLVIIKPGRALPLPSPSGRPSPPSESKLRGSGSAVRKHGKKSHGGAEYMSFIKYRVREVAADFGMTPKEVIGDRRQVFLTSPRATPRCSRTSS